LTKKPTNAEGIRQEYRNISKIYRQNMLQQQHHYQQQPKERKAFEYRQNNIQTAKTSEKPIEMYNGVPLFNEYISRQTVGANKVVML
jgi:hypothetical protein